MCPSRTSSIATSAPSKDADAHAPRKEDSVDTSALRRRKILCFNRRSTRARVSVTASRTPGSSAIRTSGPDREAEVESLTNPHYAGVTPGNCGQGPWTARRAVLTVHRPFVAYLPVPGASPTPHGSRTRETHAQLGGNQPT